MIKHTFLFLILLVFTAVQTSAQNQEKWPVSPDNGWQEVMMTVSDLNKTANDMIDIGGWEMVEKGIVDPKLIAAWKLPKETTAEYLLIRNPGNKKGLIRFVKFNNIEQKHIRPAGQVWDVGAIFDINTRVINIDEKFDMFLKRGWHAYSRPVEYGFANFKVSEVLMQGPDGIVLAMIERLEPTLEGWPNLKKISRSFNSTFIVKDHKKTAKFFTDVLGFKPYIEVHEKTRASGESVLGLPHNTSANHPLDVYIMHPNGTNDGSIEFVTLRGLEGNDYSSRSMPQNLGISVLRFPVTNIEDKAKELKTKGVVLTVPLTKITLNPYGPVTLFAFQTPDGVWIEYFEVEN